MIVLQLLVGSEIARDVRRRRDGRTLVTGLARVGILGIVGICAAGIARAEDGASSDSLLHVRRAAVASDSQIASEAGAEILRTGGNAVDAACATALALGVVNPFASGLGGGGFALVYVAATGQTVVLDFRESAPAGLTPARLGSAGIAPQSALSIGVPGEPKGLSEMVRRYGALPFSRCVAPALRLAQGFEVSPALARQAQAEIERHPSSGAKLIAAIFSIDEKAAAEMKPGHRVARPALAATLRQLSVRGAEAFYSGRIAQSLERAVARHGGVLSLADLRRYRIARRAPIETRFRGRRVLTVPPPSAGGPILIESLGILSTHQDVWQTASDPMQPIYLHAVAEVLKHGFADRARFLGDPAFVKVPLDVILDPGKQASLPLDLQHVLPHERYGNMPATHGVPVHDAGTAHISVIDDAGNAVALTTTINLEFGAGIVASGIVLNNELDDFAPAPQRPDVFALTSGRGNQAAPGKRPLSSMTPAIVIGEAGVEAVLGAAGGPRIVSATLQVLLDVLVFGLSPDKALALPRIHHQWEPDVLSYETGLPEASLRALERKGQKPMPHSAIGKVNLIVRSAAGLDAASDPRGGGRPAGL